LALTLSEVQAATEDYWVNGGAATDIYFDSTVLLFHIMGKQPFSETLVQPKDMVDGGEKIRCVLEYTKGNTGVYGNTSVISKVKVDIINAARFDWAGYYASNTIDLNDRTQNTGDAAMCDLVEKKLSNMQKTIRDTLGLAIYQTAAANVTSFGGVAGDQIVGLNGVTNQTTATAYGGIAEDDMATWSGSRYTTAAEISYRTMQKIRQSGQVGQRSIDIPDLYMTTTALKDSFANTLQSQQRFKDDKLARAGFMNILFDEVPVVADDKVPTSTYVYGVNTRFINLQTHPSFAFTKPVWEHEVESPDAWTANIRWRGQLTTNYRPSHTLATTISEAS
jgi:hypothetical protein